MNKFDKDEQHGRNLFKSILDQCKVTDAQPSQEKFDTADYYVKLGNKRIAVEIKCRNIDYMNCGTHLMEVNKFNNLVKKINDEEVDEVYYINFFGDNHCYMYDLRNIAREIKNHTVIKDNKVMNRTTAVNHGMAHKSVLLIPSQIATVLIKYDDNKWKKLINKL